MRRNINYIEANESYLGGLEVTTMLCIMAIEATYSIRLLAANFPSQISLNRLRARPVRFRAHYCIGSNNWVLAYRMRVRMSYFPG